MAHGTSRPFCAIFAALLLVSCGESSGPAAERPAQPLPLTGGEESPPTIEITPASSADATGIASPTPEATAGQDESACVLLTMDEVATAGGRAVMPPHGERMDVVSTCEWGDPVAPKIGERALESVVELTLITGGTGYFAGADAQARALFTQCTAAVAEPVADLGETACWDGSGVHVLRPPHVLSVSLSPASREGSVTLARAALARLP